MWLLEIEEHSVFAGGDSGKLFSIEFPRREKDDSGVI
jgi:hypothetical protein